MIYVGNNEVEMDGDERVKHLILLIADASCACIQTAQKLCYKRVTEVR